MLKCWPSPDAGPCNGQALPSICVRKTPDDDFMKGNARSQERMHGACCADEVQVAGGVKKVCVPRKLKNSLDHNGDFLIKRKGSFCQKTV